MVTDTEEMETRKEEEREKEDNDENELGEEERNGNEAGDEEEYEGRRPWKRKTDMKR